MVHCTGTECRPSTIAIYDRYGAYEALTKSGWRHCTTLSYKRTVCGGTPDRQLFVSASKL